ncbi:uncharacterized protein G2W53_025025 [Senna tora]|uniref:Uncharacterized protein n=1 Tax=Senna tora TaxID=362788 RepID=A0A834TD26_9FABA|nr:uncharacterized protein G2W53_025025 [Senna tora]
MNARAKQCSTAQGQQHSATQSAIIPAVHERQYLPEHSTGSPPSSTAANLPLLRSAGTRGKEGNRIKETAMPCNYKGNEVYEDEGKDMRQRLEMVSEGDETQNVREKQGYV